MKPTLHIDFETRSACDLRKAGVYVYAEHPTTEAWCAAYCVDDGPIDMWAMGDEPPLAVRAAVEGGWGLVAHNASFERQIWRSVLAARHGWPAPAVEQWRCTMAQAYAMALPGSLDEAAQAVGLREGKDMAGARLMMQMARPRRALPDGSLVWWDDAERRERLHAYCRQDVEVERQLDAKLYRLSDDEQRLWWLDQRINDRGVFVDVALCEAAKGVAAQTTKRLDRRMAETTFGEVRRCSLVADLTDWLLRQGLDVDAVGKADVETLLKRDDLADEVRGALLLRQEAAKSSVKKIDALLHGTNADGRARGLLQYHAATTGRWAGRRFQPQNLPRPIIVKDDDDEVAERLQEDAVRCILTGRPEIVEALQGPPLTIVADCIRGTVAAAPGHVLDVADFSNIEGRVLAWLAGEGGKLDAFRAYDAGTGPDLYKVAGGDIYGVPVAEVNKEQRQIGKVSELACGYQGGVGAFQTMAVTYRVTVPDAQAAGIVKAWRAANPAIVSYWADLDDAALRAVSEPGKPYLCGAVRFVSRGKMLGLQLPSGRVLSYAYPKLAPMRWIERRDGSKVTMPAEEAERRADLGEVKLSGAVFDVVSFMGVDSRTRKWCRQYAYGGKWAENVTQAVARDVMREAMFRVEAAGWPIVLTVHDELVTEPEEDHRSFAEFLALVAEVPAWAEGLPIAADGARMRRYRK